VRNSRARSAIVGGTQISTGQAPWQVALLGRILVEIEGEEYVLSELCGGVIIGETRVLTAGHCMINPLTETQAPAEDFLVVAGSADLAKIEPTEQYVTVADVRVHPYYDYAASASAPDADDIAVLTLAKSLTLSGVTPHAIGIASAGSSVPEGAFTNLTGFGEQNPETEEPNGKLYSLGMMVGFPRRCGGEADAVILCASATGGSGCSGDSGSGLTSGSPTTLVGVIDTIEVVSGHICGDGTDNGFANVAAPEIREFIEGNASPPRAPRGGGMSVNAVTRAGYPVTCEPGTWSGSPTFTYTFVDSGKGQILQSGPSPTYELTTADAGRTIYCQLQATNAGGSGVARTGALPPIEAVSSGNGTYSVPGVIEPLPVNLQEEKEFHEHPPWDKAPPTSAAGGVSLPSGSTLAIERGHAVHVKLDCTGSKECTGKLVLTTKTTSRAKGGKKRSHTITIGSVKFSIPAGETTIVKVALNATGRGLLGKDHGRLAAHVAIVDAVPGLS
jgi:Trypsin